MLYEKEKTRNISFPLGGIGTGCIGLAGNGELIDWEIFNRPNKNTRNGYSHFAVKAVQGGRTVARVLHGDTVENLIGRSTRGSYVGFGFGPNCNSLAGFPHFRDVTFEGRFPMADMTFRDADFPGTVRLCAFNPMIPHNEDDSGLPAAFFEWELENTSDGEVEYALALTVMNPAEISRNSAFCEGGKTGICFVSADKTDGEIGYADLTAVTDCPDAVAEEYWYRGGWKDPATVYWRNFVEQSRMPQRTYEDAGKEDHGTLVAYLRVPAGERRRVRFVLAWNVPIQYNYWNPFLDGEGKHVTWKNYYATLFSDSRATAAYAIEGFDRLYRQSAQFADALVSDALPDAVNDAISANLSVLKSPTVLRMEDGSLWGWEGCTENEGSCEGSCQHVWNYAYAVPFLFPRLERSLRENTMKYGLYPSGETAFRIDLPLGREPRKFRPCLDGQMGEVVKCYREWLISGDTEWLRAHAEQIFRMLEYAWSPENADRWDADCDGVLEGRQHHTLDMELFGTSSWLEGFYLLALDAGARIADAVGEPARAEKYRSLYQKGRAFTNEHLFNGEYFFQKVALDDRSVIDAFAEDRYWNDEAGEIKYQIGGGCVIDQMLADWHAAILGLDEIFDKDKKRTALQSLYRYNYKSSMRDVANMWRSFALNDESGTVICSYPDSVRKPAIPIPYCEETMTGFEYALAALMLSEGFMNEGETMVKAIRDRYDGEKRNPWNEIECGSNYVRSMASFALLAIYSGFTFDMTRGYLGFAPILSRDGRYLFSIANTWGTVAFSAHSRTLSVLGAPLTVSSFGLMPGERVRSVSADGVPIAFEESGDCVRFSPVAVSSSLRLELM